MPSYPFQTVDVFTDRRFGGNQLAVFTDARGISDADMQSLAAEMNYSETTFVLPPADPANTARVRIFNRTAEMPFAGHPNVGTGCVLAALGRDSGGTLRFEEIAGLVEVTVARDASGAVTSATIAAPQALSFGAELTAAEAAGCTGLALEDVLVARHRPIQASLGVTFFFVEVTPEALTRAAPDLAGFRRAEAARAGLDMRLSLFLYAREADHVRARMFSPLTGTWEDPATGSASATLAALTLHLDGGDALAFDIRQGAEMGRPSLLHVTARRTPDGIRATVGGGCVPVFKGEATL